jgi:tetratricopeptide (TPR) repeat protein
MHTSDGKQTASVNMSFFNQFLPTVPDSVGFEPYDVVIPVKKPSNTYRVAVLGSSAAWGYPHWEYSPWRMLNVMLRAKYPGVNFEVYCLAWNGMNSHIMRLMAEAAKPLNFDLYFVYMGNNEFKFPLAFLDDMPLLNPTHQIVHACAFLSDLRIIQAVGRGIEAVTGRPKIARAWEPGAGSDYTTMDDPGLKRVYRNYRENLDSICRSAREAGAATVLCTVASNIRTFRPYVSRNRPGLTDAESRQWDQHYRDGMAFEGTGEWMKAIGEYEQALAIDDYHADLLFRLGTCHLAAGDNDKAKGYFVRAHEQDFGLNSANAGINGVIRDAAMSHAGDRVCFADTAGLLAERSPYGVPGAEFFEDNCHMTFDGCYELIRAAYEQIAPKLPEWVRRNLRGDALAPPIEEFKEHMAASPVDLANLVDAPLGGRCRQPVQEPVCDYYQRLKAGYEKELEGKDRNKVVAESCRRAIALDGGDYYIRRNLIRSLNWGEGEAEKDARALAEEYPCHWGSWSILSGILGGLGKKDEAQEAFAHLFTDFPAYAETYHAWGDMLAVWGRYAEALAAYRRASCMKRLNTLPRMGEAKMLAQLDNIDGAVRVYSELIVQEPTRTDCYQFLDELLSTKMSSEERIALWRSLCSKLPDANLPALHLATALEDGGFLDEAMATLLRILYRDPNSVQALEAFQRCSSKLGASPGQTQ